MERKSLLQSFAKDKEGRIRAVDEVARGLACQCVCSVCGESVIARQGEIRGWHFAHVSGADCAGAAESALHLAAKQLLEDAGGMMVPEQFEYFDVRLPDNKIHRSEVREPASWVDFEFAEQEKPYFGLRPDVFVMVGNRVLFVEIAVTHFLGREKIDRIDELGVAALQIDLASMEREHWDWETLRELVVDGEHNKEWIRSIDHRRLRDKAREDALALLETLRHASTPQSPPSPPQRKRYFIDGRILDVIEYWFGVVIWCPYDRALNERIKALSRETGGKYQPDRKNWLFPKRCQPYITQRVAEWADP